MYGFLLTRRWAAAAVGVLLVVCVCLAAGAWQLQRRAEHARQDRAMRTNLAAEPVPVDRLLGPRGSIGSDEQWRRVVATGRYDAAHQLLVRNRPLAGAVGFYVLTPLVPDGGGVGLLVNRGWVPLGSSSSAPDAVPAPPAGPVRVTARLRPSEQPDDGPAAPSGQVRRIVAAEIARGLPYPVVRGYADLVTQHPRASDPAAAPTPLPAPEPPLRPHLLYSVQWFLFAALAVGAFVLLARRAARDGSQR